MRVKIKICGITQFEDARVAINLGADALGFVFNENSPRYIPPKMARRIIDRLPPFVTKTGVFRDLQAEHILQSARTAGVDTIQLAGSESPAFAASLPFPVIKAFTIDPGFDCAVLDTYTVSAFLLDTWNNAGNTFTWHIAKQAVRLRKNIILAGRLGETNIIEALDAVEPYGIDLRESVEIMPGKKNPQKMKTVIDLIETWR
jgi:phosphoribosylanthranilate isomerase